MTTVVEIETVERVYGRWAEGDFRSGEELLAGDVVFTADDPTRGAIRIQGPKAIARYMREFVNSWSHVRILADEVVGVAPGRVFVAGRQIGTGKHSGVEISDDVYALWTFREGQVVSLDHFRDRAKARMAAGLDEAGG